MKNREPFGRQEGMSGFRAVAAPSRFDNKTKGDKEGAHHPGQLSSVTQTYSLLFT